MTEKQLKKKILDSGRTLLFSNEDLKRLIIPLVIDQVLVRTVGMADTMMISSVGEAAISGFQPADGGDGGVRAGVYGAVAGGEKAAAFAAVRPDRRGRDGRRADLSDGLCDQLPVSRVIQFQLGAVPRDE